VLDTGYILYFKDFKFKDGGDPKNKYFIILKKTDDKVVVNCLPTRVNRVPAFASELEHGCINKDDRCFNCYSFKLGQCICDNGFSFGERTFIYGDRVDTYQIDYLLNTYKLGESFLIEGKLLERELQNIIDCLVNSSSTKKKYKKLLVD
jgi:hypothetical protein